MLQRQAFSLTQVHIQSITKVRICDWIGMIKCNRSFKRFMTMCWWFIAWSTTNNCIYRYVNLLYYKECGQLRVLAAYCGRLQGSVLWRMYYIECQNNLIYIYKMLSFKQKFKICIEIWNTNIIC